MSEIKKLSSQNDMNPANDNVEHLAPKIVRPYRWVRMVLFLLPPAVIVAAALYLYLDGGRFVETDNAYIKSDRATISAEVPGTVATVLVDDNQPVRAGDVLFELNNAAYRIVLKRREASLAQIAMDLAAEKLAYAEAIAEIRLHQSHFRFAQSKLTRQEELQQSKMGTEENLEAAAHDVDTAQNELKLAEKKAARLLAGLGGDPDIQPGVYPEYLAALAAREEAELDVKRTSVRAPFSGMATHVPKPGDYITPGRAVMAVVADTGMWVEANFKETKLTYIRPGQQTTITIDAYPDFEWRGTVESISEATGAEFALLPPQNATGNWVKIVQRVPVKITFDQPGDAPLLRMGMSATVTVDTHHSRSWRDLIPG